MDEIVITQRLRTTLVGGRPTTWSEVELSTREAGVIAVFKPSDAEIERGEADLAVEHLVSEASGLRSELLRLRSAFRSARDVETPRAIFRPLFAPVESDDGSVYYRPTPGRSAMFVAAGAVTGILGELMSANPAATVPVSIALIIYGGIGLAGFTSIDSQIEWSRGLPVPIRPDAAPSVDAPGAGDFHGPYTVKPSITFHHAGSAFRAVPVVDVVDGDGRVVWRRSDGSTDPERAAVVLMREADRLVEELTEREADAAQALRPPPRPDGTLE